jgi:hypothetical protein
VYVADANGLVDEPWFRDRLASGVTYTGLKRMSIAHAIVSLAKWVEFHDRYKQVIPEDCRADSKALRAEILRRGVREFRNKAIGHVWDDDTKRPLFRDEIDSLLTRIMPEWPAPPYWYQPLS